jgi:probable rRNA maturation factor
MLRALEMPRAELSVLFTGDDQIKDLNRIYRKKNRATDVLAFSQLEGNVAGANARLLGDVVVSVPTARRQAQSRGEALMAEVTMLLAHGLLHLLGWDHETVADDRRMRRETARLCAAADATTRRARVIRAPSSRVKPRTARAIHVDSIARRSSRTALF